MLAHLPGDEETSTHTQSMPVHHSPFTGEQDVAILGEVNDANAQVAAFRKTEKSFKAAAKFLSSNPLINSSLSWKQVHDRYKCLHNQFDAQDKNNAHLSRVEGGEVGELAYLLMAMIEARDDIALRKDA